MGAIGFGHMARGALAGVDKLRNVRIEDENRAIAEENRTRNRAWEDESRAQQRSNWTRQKTLRGREDTQWKQQQEEYNYNKAIQVDADLQWQINQATGEAELHSLEVQKKENDEKLRTYDINKFVQEQMLALSGTGLTQFDVKKQVMASLKAKGYYKKAEEFEKQLRVMEQEGLTAAMRYIRLGQLSQAEAAWNSRGRHKMQEDSLKISEDGKTFSYVDANTGERSAELSLADYNTLAGLSALNHGQQSAAAANSTLQKQAHEILLKQLGKLPTNATPKDHQTAVRSTIKEMLNQGDMLGMGVNKQVASEMYELGDFMSQNGSPSWQTWGILSKAFLSLIKTTDGKPPTPEEIDNARLYAEQLWAETQKPAIPTQAQQQTGEPNGEPVNFAQAVKQFKLENPNADWNDFVASAKASGITIAQLNEWGYTEATWDVKSPVVGKVDTKKPTAAIPPQRLNPRNRNAITGATPASDATSGLTSRPNRPPRTPKQTPKQTETPLYKQAAVIFKDARPFQQQEVNDRITDFVNQAKGAPSPSDVEAAALKIAEKSTAAFIMKNRAAKSQERFDLAMAFVIHQLQTKLSEKFTTK